MKSRFALLACLIVVIAGCDSPDSQPAEAGATPEQVGSTPEEPVTMDDQSPIDGVMFRFIDTN